MLNFSKTLNSSMTSFDKQYCIIHTKIHTRQSTHVERRRRDDEKEKKKKYPSCFESKKYLPKMTEFRIRRKCVSSFTAHTQFCLIFTLLLYCIHFIRAIIDQRNA